MKKITLILLLLSVTYARLSVAQYCASNVLADAPNNRYILNANGTALDKKTGLTWMRCTLGQIWSGTTCTGVAQTYNWQTALQTAESTIFAKFSDWRLPNQNELLSLVENRCRNPTINLMVFPNTQSDFVWSSSPVADEYYIYNAWIVDFYYGINSNYGYKVNNHTYTVRLVRGRQ